MKILIDTNVILDIALERKPFVRYAIQLLREAQQRNIELFITATTITDLYYIIRKEKGREITLEFIRDMLKIIAVVSVGKEIIIQALNDNMPDFEDAVQAYSARQEEISIIVTRNEVDFKKSGLDIKNPETFLHSLRKNE